MGISRRDFSKGLVLAASGLAIEGVPQVNAQVRGESYQMDESHPVAPIQETETIAQKNARLAWYREARFGMFIHFGLYSMVAGRLQANDLVVPGRWSMDMPGLGEWIMNMASIPVANYKSLAPHFNPTRFSAENIVDLAKSAGQKYIVITSKHHDGFAMFDSKAYDFNIVQASPYKRDPLKELAAECRNQGVKLGFYYSQDQDWTYPGGAALRTGDHRPPTYHWDPAQNGSFANYLHQKAIPQIKELLADYGDYPAYLWFDTPTKDMTPELASEIVIVLNKYPHLIWNNRLGGGYKGDIETPEQYIPARGFPGHDWETCMTINNTWGYKQADVDFKSTKTLLWNLIDIASKGGNFLLNIGPMGTGEVPAPEATRLREMGAWLAVNGEAIYGTQATLFGAEAGSFSTTEKNRNGSPKFVPSWKWRSTTAPHDIYIELLEWPTSAFHLEDVPRHVTRAYLLADKSRASLKITRLGTSLDIALPSRAPDPIASVLVLETT